VGHRRLTDGKFKMVSQVVTIALLITSSVSGAPPVENQGFPDYHFWTVPEMRVAIDHCWARRRSLRLMCACCFTDWAAGCCGLS